MKQVKKISIIIPVFNEESNLVWHHEVVKKFMVTKNLAHEILYVNDGSNDESLNILRQIATKDTHTKYVSLSRNFGKEVATSAGLNMCVGDAAIIIDADGQHPVNYIEQFIEEWAKGFDVVIGIRNTNSGEGVVKKYGSKLFYKILNLLTNDKTTPNSTDFRLVDRKVIDEFNKLTERTRITRGLIDWLGFKRSFVYFDADERKNKQATYSFSKLTKLAVDAFVSNSTKPLKIVGVTGLIVTLVSGLLGTILLLEKYAFGEPWNLGVSGSAMLAVFLSFLVGTVLVCQGLLALYIESIHNETQNRPLYIVAEKN